MVLDIGWTEKIFCTELFGYFWSFVQWDFWFILSRMHMSIKLNLSHKMVALHCTILLCYFSKIKKNGITLLHTTQIGIVGLVKTFSHSERNHKQPIQPFTNILVGLNIFYLI